MSLVVYLYRKMFNMQLISIYTLNEKELKKHNIIRWWYDKEKYIKNKKDFRKIKGECVYILMLFWVVILEDIECFVQLPTGNAEWNINGTQQ